MATSVPAVWPGLVAEPSTSDCIAAVTPAPREDCDGGAEDCDGGGGAEDCDKGVSVDCWEAGAESREPVYGSARAALARRGFETP